MDGDSLLDIGIILSGQVEGQAVDVAEKLCGGGDVQSEGNTHGQQDYDFIFGVRLNVKKCALLALAL